MMFTMYIYHVITGQRADKQLNIQGCSTENHYFSKIFPHTFVSFFLKFTSLTLKFGICSLIITLIPQLKRCRCDQLEIIYNGFQFFTAENKTSKGAQKPLKSPVA